MCPEKSRCTFPLAFEAKTSISNYYLQTCNGLVHVLVLSLAEMFDGFIGNDCNFVKVVLKVQFGARERVSKVMEGYFLLWCVVK